MSPEMLEFFSEVGELTGDTSVGRGLVTCVGMAAVVLTAGWRLVRRKKPDVERVKVVVDAPHGEKVSVQIGNERPRIM